VAIWVTVVFSVLVSFWAGGASLPRRIQMGGFFGALVGLLYTILHSVQGILFNPNAKALAISQILAQSTPSALWKMFLFTLLSIFAVLIFEARPVGKSP
jgi:hypothetical protein